MSTENQNTSADKMITLMGGAEISVTLQDSSTQTVKVLQLPIKTYPALRASLLDEVRLAALYCGKDAGWAEQLTPKSHTEVIKEGKRINWDFFSAWAERQKEMAALLPKTNPEETAAIVEAVARANPDLFRKVMMEAAGSTSPTGSPASAPKPG
jgi:hypothetical protein